MEVSEKVAMWAHRLILGVEPPTDYYLGCGTRFVDEVWFLRSLIHADGFTESTRYKVIFDGATPPPAGANLLGRDRTLTIVTADDVRWGYRLILGREPENESVVRSHLKYPEKLHLVAGIAGSPEFKNGVRRKHLLSVSSKPVRSPLGKRYLELPISDLPERCYLDSKVKFVDGLVRYPLEREQDIGRLRLHVHPSTLRPQDSKNVLIHLESIPDLRIAISHSNQEVRVGENCNGDWYFQMWGQSSVKIGANSTANGAVCLINDGGLLSIGEDCMFAQVFFHVGDNHAIFDVKSNKVLNYRVAPRIEVGDHVWVGARATVIADCSIGSGSIVAAEAVVKGEVPPVTLAAGVPAKPIRQNVSWTRDPDPTGLGVDDVMQFLRTKAGLKI
jgi:acetyltransferase-like isoleucine patch superfamily enzyme